MTLTRSQLLERIESVEWSDLEVKAAQRDVPKDAYKTVSAFANTAGGYLVFGVEQNGREFNIVGVTELDKVQNDFLSAMRSLDKISCQISTKEELISTEQGNILAFYIPEAESRHKPVHLSGDIRQSFIRRGGCDQKCNGDDIRRFLRLSARQPYESELVDTDLSVAIDEAAIGSYRRIYERRESAAECNAFDTPRFLEHWALAVPGGNGVLRPTKAAILLFGTGAALRRLLPRPLVDCRWATHKWDDPIPAERWSDRLLCEDNLWKSWEQLLDRYVRNSSKPFALDIDTLERREKPENFISFREAAINILMHQDFEEVTRSAIISFHPDRVVFENPGASRIDKAKMLVKGPKEVRNPLIVAMFRRVGLGDQAGTGMGAIFGDWTRRGWIPPEIVNDIANYSFRLSLLAKKLLSDEQDLFQARFGANLSAEEASALAILCVRAQVTVSEFCASLSLGRMDVAKIVGRLETQILARKVTTSEGDCYELAEHLRERWPLPTDGLSSSANLVTDQVGSGQTGLVTDQAGPDQDGLVSDQPLSGRTSLITVRARRARSGPPLTGLTDQQRRLLAACGTPRATTELMELLGVTHRPRFRTHHLQPLLDQGLLQLLIPDKPNHPGQRYILTPVGARIVARQIREEETDR